MKSRIDFLVSEINLHNHLHYVLNESEITDEEYDILFKELQALEQKYPEFSSPDSPTQKVSIKPAEGFTKIKHDTRMLSIGNTFSEEGIISFDAKMQEIAGHEVEYSVENKFDGLAISLRYFDGKLSIGATRGNYEEGENVTANAMYIKSIPKKILYTNELDVRGEVMMDMQTFIDINKERQKNGEKLYANPRNAASGALRMLDPKETGKRNLIFKAYNITDKTLPDGIQTQEQVLNKLKELGFPVGNNNKIVISFQGIKDYYKQVSENRHLFGFDIDGVVIKANDLALQAEAGYVAREPRAMIAYKFNQQEAYTTVKAIDVQVGRTGVLTPVARLTPISLGGVVVSNATLHNINIINDLDVRVGDTVKVRRNGDVIPGILEVDFSKRIGNEVKFEMPTHCPCCGSIAKKENDKNAAVRCTGGSICTEQSIQKLVWFVSRPAMNIEDVGEALCRDLFNTGLIKTPSDLFNLQVSDIETLPGYAKKSAENAINSLVDARQPALRKFITALGIRNVGEGTAKRLEETLGDFDVIRNASYETLTSINDIGEVVATSLIEYFNENNEQLDKLISVLNIQNPEKKDQSILVEGINGKTFVITGTLDGMSRDAAKVWIESMGGKTSGSVSKKTHYVLAGAEAGTKLDKAIALGVKVLSLDDVKNMIIK